ncbi:SPW repeat domain-containing protein [Natrinema soli]|uniref:SPW repeat protein n=1 Tax=Natrinema soli TaxID=1930624 RepID=A0ABD5SKM6_9EURY|nr:SPW repeat protein [Natrinema soli]
MDTITKLTTGGNSAFGCWLIVAPFVFNTPAVGRWNDVLVGTTIALVAGYNYTRAIRRRPVNMLGAGFVTVLGCWLIVAPFVFGLESSPIWNDIISGTIVASFGSYNTYVATIADRSPPFRMTAE